MKLAHEALCAAIAAAGPDKHAGLAAALAQAYGAGGLTDAEYEDLDGQLAAERRVALVAPTKVVSLASACVKLLSMGAPPPSAGEGDGTAASGFPTSDEAAEPEAVQAPAAEGIPAGAAAVSEGIVGGHARRRKPPRPHHRTGSRPRTPDSLARRRTWLHSGFMHPKLALPFTSGEVAVLATIASEVGKRGACRLPIGQIAALAGVCDTVVKRTLRLGKTVGLLNVEERRLGPFRNDTNVVRVVSLAWLAWLRVRMPRAARAGFLGGGGTVVPGACRDSGKKGAKAWNRAPLKPVAVANPGLPPPSRTAAA